jgi:hypothetical protein
MNDIHNDASESAASHSLKLRQRVWPVSGLAGSAAAASLAIVAVVGLVQGTAADRLVDSGYDKAIAISVAHDAATTSIGAHVGTSAGGLLRLAVQPVPPVVSAPTAATEHAWLTRVDASVPASGAAPAGGLLPVVPDHLVPRRGIGDAIKRDGATVGARLTLSNMGDTQILEVVNVTEISADLISPLLQSADARPRLIMVSCRVVESTKSAVEPSIAGQPLKLVRFIIEADAAQPVRL